MTLPKHLTDEQLERATPGFSDADLDLRVLNCARCRVLLLAPGQHRQPWHPEFVAGRVYGRPYCAKCLLAAKRKPLPPENLFAIPSQE